MLLAASPGSHCKNFLDVGSHHLRFSHYLRPSRARQAGTSAHCAVSDLWTQARRTTFGVRAKRRLLLLMMVGLGTLGCDADKKDQSVRPGLHQLLHAELADQPVLSDFYLRRNSALYWLDRSSRALEQFMAVLDQAESHGLDGSRFNRDQISRWLHTPPVDHRARVQAEALIMRNFLKYTRHLHRGLDAFDPEDNAWHIPRPKFDTAAALKDLENLGPQATWQSRLPERPAYRRLRAARQRVVGWVAAGGWPTIDGEDLIQPGDRHPQLPDLRQRLITTGWLKAADLPQKVTLASPRYDAITEQAVRRFQRRYGLHVDGIIGPEARSMLNYPAELRLAQVDANLERLRWLPRKPQDDRIEVNIAAQKLRAYREGEIVLNMRVIVGKTHHRTPAFYDRLRYVEINPSWTVPTSISVREIAPKVADDPDYLAAHNMVVLEGFDTQAPQVDPTTINWSEWVGDTSFPWVLRQLPGPENALGQIKFMFPNDYAIYLHDTPNRELFNRADRTFSHGCIRVSDPLALAGYLFHHTQDWDVERTRSVIDSRQQTRVDLAEADQVPIYLLYQTAWADSDGKLHFRTDNYNRDRKLMDTLRAPEQRASAE